VCRDCVVGSIWIWKCTASPATFDNRSHFAREGAQRTARCDTVGSPSMWPTQCRLCTRVYRILGSNTQQAVWKGLLIASRDNSAMTANNGVRQWLEYATSALVKQTLMDMAARLGRRYQPTEKPGYSVEETRPWAEIWTEVWGKRLMRG